MAILKGRGLIAVGAGVALLCAAGGSFLFGPQKAFARDVGTASPTNASSLEQELQQLSAELQSLATFVNSGGQQGEVLGTSITDPPATANGIFYRDFTLGDAGPDVLALQRFLNAQGGQAQIATSGPGSPGNETDYFGLYTLTALARWQTMEGITPAQGDFDTTTRAMVEAMD